MPETARGERLIDLRRSPPLSWTVLVPAVALAAPAAVWGRKAGSVRVGVVAVLPAGAAAAP